ncbi:MAG: hypothetical protein V3U84_02255, partial [Thiotrichaceae bacterium]
MENFATGIASSLIEGLILAFGGGILAIVGRWQGWWGKPKSNVSIELATKVLQFLDGDAEDKTIKMINATKELGKSLVIFYKNKTSYNKDREKETTEILAQLLATVKPLATELSAANPELDHLKRAVIEYQYGLEYRTQIINELCHPRDVHAINPENIYYRLLSANVCPRNLLNAAKGEATLFLRGNGVNWLARQIRK